MERRSDRRAFLICSVGSTDPTVRAGIGRDLVVYQRLGACGVFAVAAVTAQNSRRVIAVQPLPPALLTAQLRAIWQESLPAAIRIGLLPTRALIAAVARFVRTLRPRPPIVLDPVIAASSGHRFLDLSTLRALAGLLPLVTIVTPNIDEAEALTGERIRSTNDAARVALRLSERGCAVLLKGGHLRGTQVVDVLAAGGRITRLAAPRIHARMRGTGCTLAAALAVNLARGVPLTQAIRRARAFVRRELEAHRPGRVNNRT